MAQICSVRNKTKVTHSSPLSSRAVEWLEGKVSPSVSLLKDDYVKGQGDAGDANRIPNRDPGVSFSIL